MANRKITKDQTTIYKTKHRQSVVNSGAPEELSVPVLIVSPVVYLLNIMLDGNRAFVFNI